MTVAASAIPKTDRRFPHGTPRGYRADCECDPCVEAMRVYWAEEGRRLRRGELIRVPADEARAYLEHLLRAVPDATRHTLMHATGVDRQTIKGILHGQPTVRPETHAAIMRTTRKMVERDLAKVDAKKAKQVYHSLRAQGYPGIWICRQLGYTSSNASPSFVAQDMRTVTIEVHRRVLDLADRVGDTPGPSEAAARTAQRAGHRPLRFYDAHGDLIPEPEPRDGGDMLVLRRLCVLRSILTEGMSVSAAGVRHGARLRPETSWHRLHMPAPGWDQTLETLTYPAEYAPTIRIIRRHVAAIPLSWAAVGSDWWTVEDVDPAYCAKDAWRALVAECDRLHWGRVEGMLGVRPGTWTEWAMSPASRPPRRPRRARSEPEATVHQLAPQRAAEAPGAPEARSA